MGNICSLYTRTDDYYKRLSEAAGDAIEAAECYKETVENCYPDMAGLPNANIFEKFIEEYQSIIKERENEGINQNNT
jgi:broad specificity phosphatase PhoE